MRSSAVEAIYCRDVCAAGRPLSVLELHKSGAKAGIGSVPGIASHQGNSEVFVLRAEIDIVSQDVSAEEWQIGGDNKNLGGLRFAIHPFHRLPCQSLQSFEDVLGTSFSF